MIMTENLKKYFAGKLDELTEEEIKWCEWTIAVHAPPKITLGTTGKSIDFIPIKWNSEFIEKDDKDE